MIDSSQGCGIVSGSCALAKLNCTTMVLAGNGTGGQAYWALQAVKGFHAKLDMIHEKCECLLLRRRYMRILISESSTRYDVAKLDADR